MIYSLITEAKLNAIDPRASLADVLACIANHPASRLEALLRWHWKATQDHRIKPSPLDHRPAVFGRYYGQWEVTAAGSGIGRSGECWVGSTTASRRCDPVTLWSRLPLTSTATPIVGTRARTRSISRSYPARRVSCMRPITIMSGLAGAARLKPTTATRRAALVAARPWKMARRSCASRAYRKKERRPLGGAVQCGGPCDYRPHAACGERATLGHRGHRFVYREPPLIPVRGSAACR